MSTPTPVPVSRQVAFFPPESLQGKYHAAWEISHTPVCGARVTLDTDSPIRTRQGQERVHPIVCRRCLRLSVSPGVSANGIKK